MILPSWRSVIARVLIALSSDRARSCHRLRGEPRDRRWPPPSTICSAEQKPSGLMVPLREYADVFQTAFADRMVRRPELASAQLHIYGQLEARLTESDRVILGGLVEGVWPPAPRIDPWLSRPMRHELGLDLPERRIGLSAHDFAQLLGHERRHPHPFGEGRRRAGGRLALPAPAGSRRRRGALEAGRSGRRQAMSATPARLDRPHEVKPIKQPAPRPPRADAAD